MFERRAKSGQPPLNRRQLGTRDPLWTVGLAGDQDQHDARHARSLIHPRASAVKRRLLECSLDGLGA